MDSKKLFEQDQKKKNIGINDSVIKVERNDAPDELKRIMTVSDIEVNDEANDSFNDSYAEELKKENGDLIREGLDQLKEFDEKEVELNERRSIQSFVEEPVLAPKTRLKRFAEYPRLKGKDGVKAAGLLGPTTAKLVKKGTFDNRMISTGQAFIKKLTTWADSDRKADAAQKNFDRESGADDILGCLYVDGLPIKEFVSSQYGYRGSRDAQTERGILSAYAAMIASRRNHPITLVRPVIVNGVADVEIRNVGIDMSVSGQKMSRGQTIDAIRYGINGEVYRQYCETAYRSQKKAEAGDALRTVKGKSVEGLKKLIELNRNLKAAGKGKHSNYDEFLLSFSKYFDMLNYIGLDPDNMEVDRDELVLIHQLSCAVVKTANDYLKGKKMNLPRHNAVKEIRDLVSSQSGPMWGVLRSGQLKDKDSTISLKDLLDQRHDEFVVYGMEEDTQSNREKQLNNASDKNEYISLPKDMEMKNRTRKVMVLKKKIHNDKDANYAFLRFRNAYESGSQPDDVIDSYALAFLKAAAAALLGDEEAGAALRRKFKNAENREELLNLTARDQLLKIFEHEITTMPPMKKALDIWNEQTDSARAAQMSYKENTLGRKYSKQDYDQYGGAVSNLYVTDKEAAEIVEKSKGFLCAVNVKGQKGLKMIKPSMPEKIKIKNDKDKEETVYLRRTMNLMFKTIAYMTTNEDGTVKDEVEKYDGTAITEQFDELFRVIFPGDVKSDAYITGYNFVAEKLQPAMEEILKAEYLKKGMSKSEAAYKANHLSIDTCESFFKILNSNTGTFVQSSDVGIHNLRCTGTVLRSLNREEFINSPEVKQIRIDGKAPTEKEINQALDDFLKEQEAAEAELKNIREMDPDSEQTISFNSCVDNSKYLRGLMITHTGDLNKRTLEYKPKSAYRNNPVQMAEYLLMNLDKMCDIDATITQEKRDEYRKNLNDAIAFYKKEGRLNLTHSDNLRWIADRFAKYDTHLAPNISSLDTDIITIETSATEPDMLIHSPVTLNPKIGRYKSRGEHKIDDESGTIEHKGFTGFHSSDDYYAHTKARMSILKVNLKRILNVKIGRKSDSEIA